MEIERAAQADFDSVLELLSSVAKWLNSKGIDQWGQFLTDEGKGILEIRYREGDVYKIQHEGKLAGVFVTQTEDKFWASQNPKGKTVWIHTLAIARPFRGLNFGLEVLDWIESKAIGNGMRFTRLDCGEENKKLCAYYENAGYRKIASQDWNGLEIRLMEKSLLCSQI